MDSTLAAILIALITLCLICWRVARVLEKIELILECQIKHLGRITDK